MEKIVKRAVMLLIGMILLLSLTGCKSKDEVAFGMDVDDFFDNVISLAEEYYPEGDFSDLVRDDNYDLHQGNDYYNQYILKIDDKSVITLYHTTTAGYGDGAVIRSYAKENDIDYEYDSEMWEALAYGVCLTVNPDCNFDNVLELMQTALDNGGYVPTATTTKDGYYYAYMYFPANVGYSHNLEISGEF